MTPAAAGDAEVLAALEGGIPVEARPFRTLAERLGLAEEALLERTRGLLAEGRIKRIAVSFDSRALGFAATLAAAHTAPGRFAEAAALVSSFDEVTHNYRRGGSRFDMWFTLVAASSARIEEALRILRESGHFEEILELPATRVFKVDVRFATERPAPGKSASDTDFRALGAAEKRVVEALGGGIEVVARPFERAAQAAGVSEDEAVSMLGSFLERGIARKVAAVLDARSLGLAGALVAWRVPDDDVERAGDALAAIAGVTHCYARRTTAEWPYGLYTMMHAAGEAALADRVKRTSRDLGLADHVVLPTLEELKKAPPRYRFEEAE